jgi:hypothetical protein
LLVRAEERLHLPEQRFVAGASSAEESGTLVGRALERRFEEFV